LNRTVEKVKIAAIWENPEKNWSKFNKKYLIQQNSGKFCKNNQQTIQQF